MELPVLRRTGDTADNAGGMLHVKYTFDYPEEIPKPITALILHPVDRNRSVTVIYINPEITGKDFGPFPPGKYSVSLVTEAFQSKPSVIPVTIKMNTIPSIDFLLMPRGGAICGLMLAQPGDKKKVLKSVTLSGIGVKRTLVPLKEKEIDILDHYFSGRDFADKTSFYFFNLPSGEYDLSVIAEGYKQYKVKRNIIEGQTDLQTINLIPLK
jgi:hypothetical protein